MLRRAGAGLLVPVAPRAQAPRNPFAELFGRAPERTGREFTAVQFRTRRRADGPDARGRTSTRRQRVPEGLSRRRRCRAGRASTCAIACRSLGQAATATRNFASEPAFGVPAFDAGVRVDFKATTRLSFQGGGQFTRSPFFQLMWLPPELRRARWRRSTRSAILLMRQRHRRRHRRRHQPATRSARASASAGVRARDAISTLRRSTTSRRAAAAASGSGR